MIHGCVSSCDCAVHVNGSPRHWQTALTDEDILYLYICLQFALIWKKRKKKKNIVIDIHLTHIWLYAHMQQRI